MIALKGARRASLIGLYALALTTAAFAQTTSKRTATTTLIVTPPPATAPEMVVATPGNAKVVLTWAAVPDATGYRIYRTSTGVFGAPVASTTSTSHTSWSLVNGTSYSFMVAGYTNGGNGPASSVVSATPMAPPAGLTAAFGDQQVTLNWQPSTGATSYTIYRKTGAETVYGELLSGVMAPPYVDANLTNGQKYYYRVRAVGPASQSDLSSTVSATPLPPPPALAPVVTAAPGNARVTLTWNALPDATSYKIYRSESGVFDGPAIGSTSSTTFKNYSLVNGTTYHYLVAGRNLGGEGPRSDIVTATPVAPPLAPADLVAVAGDKVVTLSWLPSEGAASYSVYRGTLSNKQVSVPIAQGLATPAFVDNTVVNGPTYFYKVTAANAGGTSPRSNEASASPEAPPPPTDPAALAAFRFLRQTAWGPKPGDVDALVAGGNDFNAFIDQQFAAAPSEYPNALYSQPTEMTQEHFMHLALTGPDQLRQRVAWALHKIWVVSAVEVPRADAIVNYQRVLMANAFGNYRELMKAVTLNPAMGRYLNMLNNRSQAVTGVPPNENYPREVMQLFTIGIPRLNPDGSPVAGPGTYTENDVKELARIFTGWTFGDGNPATIPTKAAKENWRVPMEAVAAFHDSGPKTFLGVEFPAGQTAAQDLEQALDVLFAHPNVAPFIGRQLIQQLATSNPSAGYVERVAGVFTTQDGDLAAVVRAVLTDPEARLSDDFSGKLSEPVLFVVSQLRALNASVTDHPFMSDKTEAMGQKVFYPPSVFSYYSPGYRVRGTMGPTGAPLGGPEFQILTSVTALERANFVGSLLGGWFGTDVAFDYVPFTSLAADPAALVDYCSRLFMGTRISPEMRAEIIRAVRVSPATSTRERARTAIYLTLVAAQTQVDR